MPKYNIRFADFATRAALFELQVEQDTTVGALKAMAEEHLSNSDALCPMKYFDKWYLEVRVGDRNKFVGIDEGDEGLALAGAGLEDESVAYLEGPMFEQGQAELGRAIAAVRVQAKVQAAQYALQVRGLMAEMGRRFDDMAAKQQAISKAHSDALDNILKRQNKAEEQYEKLGANLKKQSEVIDRRFDAMAANQQELSEVGKSLRKDWNGVQLKQCKAEVDSLLKNHSNRPLKALWEVLNDRTNPEMELPMAIIMDRRCGIERRAELADGPMKFGYTINIKDREGATPLIMAVTAGRNDVVSALLANGADCNAMFGANFVALHVAAINNNVGAIELLVSYGAEVSKRKKDGYTPLHNAAFNGHAAAIEALVRLGADLTIVNGDRNTPLQTFIGGSIQHLSEADQEQLKALLAPKA